MHIGQRLCILHLHPIRAGQIGRRHDAGLVGKLKKSFRVALERRGLRFLPVNSENGEHLAPDRVDLVRAPFDVARGARQGRAVPPKQIEGHGIGPELFRRTTDGT